MRVPEDVGVDFEGGVAAFLRLQGVFGVDIGAAEVGGGAAIGLDAVAVAAQELVDGQIGNASQEVPEGDVDAGGHALGEADVGGHPLPEAFAVQGVFTEKQGFEEGFDD